MNPDYESWLSLAVGIRRSVVNAAPSDALRMEVISDASGIPLATLEKHVEVKRQEVFLKSPVATAPAAEPLEVFELPPSSACAQGAGNDTDSDDFQDVEALHETPEPELDSGLLRAWRGQLVLLRDAIQSKMEDRNKSSTEMTLEVSVRNAVRACDMLLG